MDAVVVVSIVVFVLLLTLGVFLVKRPYGHKHYQSAYEEYRYPHKDGMGNGKLRHNRTRRASRRANYNGAWREK
jgi:hypothetical protein